MFFFELWVGWAVKYTLRGKFGSPAQKGGKASLGKRGAVANNGGKGSRIDHGRWGPAWRGQQMAHAWRRAAAYLLPTNKPGWLSVQRINQIYYKKKLCTCLCLTEGVAAGLRAGLEKEGVKGGWGPKKHFLLPSNAIISKSI
jgi:hypothetical protein